MRRRPARTRICERTRVLKCCTFGALVLFIIGGLSTFWQASRLESAEQSKQELNNIPPKHRLCLLVPFRDRFDELMQFLPHMGNFLLQQDIDHLFLVINQVDIYRYFWFIPVTLYCYWVQCLIVTGKSVSVRSITNDLL